MVVKDLAIVYLITDLAFYNRIDTIFLSCVIYSNPTHELFICKVLESQRCWGIVWLCQLGNLIPKHSSITRLEMKQSQVLFFLEIENSTCV